MRKMGKGMVKAKREMLMIVARHDKDAISGGLQDCPNMSELDWAVSLFGSWWCFKATRAIDIYQ